jgi:hypothetical protein
MSEAIILVLGAFLLHQFATTAIRGTLRVIRYRRTPTTKGPTHEWHDDPA